MFVRFFRRNKKLQVTIQLGQAPVLSFASKDLYTFPMEFLYSFAVEILYTFGVEFLYTFPVEFSSFSRWNLWFCKGGFKRSCTPFPWNLVHLCCGNSVHL
jgi:hypothetical protein